MADPFHNDPHLLAVIDSIANGQGIKLFVETGTHVGTGLKYMAETYPSLMCYSCEPHMPTYKAAMENLKPVSGRVSVFAGTSEAFFERFQNMMPYRMQEPAMFWLDAHSHGFGAPLPEEVAFVTRAWVGGYILIDDFQVPEHPGFGYDVYKRGALSWELIKDSVALERVTGLWYPGYEPGPPPGGRGWVLLTFGSVAPWPPPETLRDKVWEGTWN
jgi:hypothetical protein